MPECCESCHEKTATVHLCEIVDGNRTLLNLCEECFRLRARNSYPGVPVLDGSQTCDYCGETAMSVSLNHQWEREVRRKDTHYACRRCADLEHRFMMQALEGISEQLEPEAMTRALKRAVEETDRRVRSAVAG